VVGAEGNKIVGFICFKGLTSLTSTGYSLCMINTETSQTETGAKQMKKSEIAKTLIEVNSIFGNECSMDVEVVDATARMNGLLICEGEVLGELGAWDELHTIWFSSKCATRKMVHLTLTYFINIHFS